MAKHADSQNTEDSLNDESEVITLLKKVQQHLSFLEKKIDTLVEGSSNNRSSRPSGSDGYSGGRSSGGYSGGRSSGGYSGGRSSGGYSGGRSSGGSSEGGSYSGGSSFDRSRGGQGSGDSKKRAFRPKRDS